MRAPLLRRPKLAIREILLTMPLSRSIWQVMLCVHGGQPRIDIRSYWGEPEDLKPSKKGFVLTLAEIDGFIDALQRGRARLMTLNERVETGDTRAT